MHSNADVAVAAPPPPPKLPVQSIVLSLPHATQHETTVHVRLSPWRVSFAQAYASKLHDGQHEKKTEQQQQRQKAASTRQGHDVTPSHSEGDEEYEGSAADDGVHGDDDNNEHNTDDEEEQHVAADADATHEHAQHKLPPPYWLPHLLAHDDYYLQHTLGVMYGWMATTATDASAARKDGTTADAAVYKDADAHGKGAATAATTTTDVHGTVPYFPYTQCTLYVAFERHTQQWHLLDVHPRVYVRQQQQQQQKQKQQERRRRSSNSGSRRRDHDSDEDEDDNDDEQQQQQHDSDADDEQHNDGEDDENDEEGDERDDADTASLDKASSADDSDDELLADTATTAETAAMVPPLLQYDEASLYVMDVPMLAAAVQCTMALRYCVLQPHAVSLTRVQQWLSCGGNTRAGMTLLLRIATALATAHTRDARWLPHRIPDAAIDYNVLLLYAQQRRAHMHTTQVVGNNNTTTTASLSAQVQQQRQLPQSSLGDTVLCSSAAVDAMAQQLQRIVPSTHVWLCDVLRLLLSAHVLPSRPLRLHPHTVRTLDDVLLLLWLLLAVPRPVLARWGIAQHRRLRRVQRQQHDDNDNDGNDNDDEQQQQQHDAADATEYDDDDHDSDDGEQQQSNNAQQRADGDAGALDEDDEQQLSLLRGTTMTTATAAATAAAAAGAQATRGQPLLPSPLLLYTLLEVRRRLTRERHTRPPSRWPLLPRMEPFCDDVRLEDGLAVGSDPLVCAHVVLCHNDDEEEDTAVTEAVATIAAAADNDGGAATTSVTHRLYQSDLVLLLLALTTTPAPHTAPRVVQHNNNNNNNNNNSNNTGAHEVAHTETAVLVRPCSSDDDAVASTADAHLPMFVALLHAKLRCKRTVLQRRRAAGMWCALLCTLPRFAQPATAAALCEVVPLYTLLGRSDACALSLLLRVWSTALSLPSSTAAPACAHGEHKQQQQQRFLDVFVHTFWHELHCRLHVHGELAAVTAAATATAATTTTMTRAATTATTSAQLLSLLLDKVRACVARYDECLQLFSSKLHRHSLLPYTTSVPSECHDTITLPAAAAAATTVATAAVATATAAATRTSTITKAQCDAGDDHAQTSRPHIVNAVAAMTLLQPDPYSRELQRAEARVAALFASLPMTPRSYLTSTTLHRLLFDVADVDVVAVRYVMLRAGVSTVRQDALTQRPMPALEYALRARNAAVAQLLVALGCTLDTLTEGGRCTLESLAETCLDAPALAQLRRTWRANEHIRGQNALTMHGMLQGVCRV